MSHPLLGADALENQRREPRYHVSWPARVQLADGREIDARVRDISDSGLGMRSEVALPHNGRLTLVVGVPDLADPSHLQAVPGTLDVTYMVMSGGEWRTGGRWAQLSPAAHTLYQHWIHRLRFG